MLPSSERAAGRLGLPLHRGPHRRYNALVIERTGQIEGSWSAARWRDPVSAADAAAFRLALLQRALKRRLLEPPGRPVQLNRNDPLGTGYDFTELDAMAEALWRASHIALAESSSRAA